MWGADVTLRYPFAKLAGKRFVIYILFALVYTFPTLSLARHKLLWDDEFFTLYLSTTRGWHELLRALATGADQHPPSFYYLTHLALKLLGMSHLVLRLPSIAGYALLCICLYEIVRFLATPLWGIVALLFPLGANLYYYATEARGYGMVSGFMALAVLAWLHATTQPRRVKWLVALAVALAAAAGCHYYAVMAAACLALGELVRTRAQRKIDVPVWIAFAFTCLPIAAFLKTIRSARGYSTHFWAVPVWSDAIRFYQAQLALMVLALLGSVALVLVLQRNFRSTNGPEVARSRVWTAWEATTITSLAMLPVIVMFLAKFVTHGFADRYAISAVIGVVALLLYTLHRLVPAPQAALVAVLACGVMYLYQVHNLADYGEIAKTRTLSEIARLSRADGQNTAVMDITPFHRISFYAPRAIASRVFYLSDPNSSVRYLGHDTIDRGLLDLRPWFPIPVVPAGTFLRENSHYYVFGAINGWNWLTYELPKWGDAQLLNRGQQGVLLFSVTNVRPSSFPVQDDPHASEALFNQMPKTGPSLCELWMGPKDCLR